MIIKLKEENKTQLYGCSLKATHTHIVQVATETDP